MLSVDRAVAGQYAFRIALPLASAPPFGPLPVSSASDGGTRREPSGVEWLGAAPLVDRDEAVPEERPLLALLRRRGLPAIAPAPLPAHSGRASPALGPPAIEDHLDEGEVLEPAQEMLIEIEPLRVHDDEPSLRPDHGALYSAPTATGRGSADSGLSAAPGATSPRSRIRRDR